MPGILTSPLVRPHPRGCGPAARSIAASPRSRRTARLLRKLGYSLQSNRKTREGSNHPDRDAQFLYLDRQMKEHMAEQSPVVSVDTKRRSWSATSRTALKASIGIATGLVVVGEHLGAGDTRQHVAIGEAPNVAAQLQAVATPGEIVIAASTRRLAGGCSSAVRSVPTS